MARPAPAGGLARAATLGGPVVFGPAQPADDAAIRALLRAQPMGTRIRATLEREPDARLAAGIEGDRHHTVVARDPATGRVMGVGSRAVRRVWVGGEPVRIGYLGQLRRDPAMRARMRLLAAGFRAMARTRQPDELSCDLTTIVAGNETAVRLLERRLPGFPVYRPLCELTSLTLPVPRRPGRQTGPARRATADQLPAIADCLQRNLRGRPFAPVWTAEDLADPARCRDLAPGDFHVIEEQGRVVACLALWDQRRFKQAVIHGYGGALGRLRPALDAWSTLRGRPRLPRPGEAMRMAYLSHVAVDGDGDAADRLHALVAAACRTAASRGIEYLVIGMASEDPALERVRRRFGGHVYPSTLYLVHDAADPVAARLPGPGLPHVEVATL